MIVEDLVTVVCVHIRGVSPIQGAGLEGCHCTCLTACFLYISVTFGSVKFKPLHT